MISGPSTSTSRFACRCVRPTIYQAIYAVVSSPGSDKRPRLPTPHGVGWTEPRSSFPPPDEGVSCDVKAPASGQAPGARTEG